MMNYTIQMGNPSQVSPASHLGVEAMGLLKARLLVQQQQQQQQQQLLQSAHGSAFAAAAARHASFVQHQQQQKLQINQLNNPAAIVAELQRRSHSLPTAATAVLTELQLRKALMEGSNPIFGANPTQENMQESNEVSTMTAATTNTASPTNSKSQKSQDKHSATAFQFPWKLHDMLDRTKAEGNENIVSWVEGGKAFRVHVTEAFVNDILPRFFKQTKYKSFQRQLNLYGFTRLHNGPNKGGYKHTYFQQGQRSLCQLINRNSSSTQNSIGVLSNTISESEAIRDDALSKYRNKKNHSNDINISDSCNQDSNDAATGATSSAQLISPRSQPILSNQVPSFTRIQGHDAAIRIKQFQNQQILAAKQMQRKEEEERLKQRLKGYEAERQLLQLQQSREDEGKTCATGLFDTSTLMGNDPRILSPGVNRESSLPASCTERDVAPTIDIDALGTKATLDTNNNASDRNFRTEEESDDKIKDVADACVSVSSAASIRENTNKLGPEKQKNSLVFHFPYKLYEMLQEAEANNFAHTISWLPGTSCFKVHDTGNFVNRIMPSYFKQTKLKSFQRQLNLYGFIRISSGFCKGGYCHPNFIRGRKDLLNAVLRMKIKGTGKARGKYRSSASANSKRSASSMASLAQNKLLVDTCRGISTTSLMCDVPTSPGGNSATESGIDVILEAIKTRERKDTHNTSNVQPIEDDLPGSSNSSRCSVPSTIDVNINDSADVRNADGLSWRMDPSESYSDWTIDVVSDERVSYHVHRRVLAVGPKKSDYFAKIFKSNIEAKNSTNRNQLHLRKSEAAVFPMILDYIYADVEFDLDTEKAFALYSVGDKIENESILKRVTDYYAKGCMSKVNIVDFIRLGQSFDNTILLDTALLQCSKDIWSMDSEKVADMEPGMLYQVLIFALARDEENAEKNTIKLSEIVATCISNATQATLTPEIFRSLTDKSMLPYIDPIAAIKLLATENIILNGIHESPLEGDSSLHERCISAISENWGSLRQQLAKNGELSNMMRSLSSILLFKILMKATQPERRCSVNSSDSSITF